MGTWDGLSYSGIAGLVAAGRIVSTMTPPSGASMAIGAAEASQALSLSGTQTRLFAGQTAVRREKTGNVVLPFLPAGVIFLNLREKLFGPFDLFQRDRNQLLGELDRRIVEFRPGQIIVAVVSFQERFLDDQIDGGDDLGGVLRVIKLRRQF